jgi:hypothetical protein
MRKKIALFGVLAAMATAAVLLITPATGSAWPGNGVGWQQDNGLCGMADGDGNFFTTSLTKLTFDFVNGTVTFVCKAQPVDNSTGHAVLYNFDNTEGSLCGIPDYGETDNWHETVSKTGKATLVCEAPLLA